ncbi:succinylglutamate-semialdehyde dehydrogenase [Asticcacaulis sp. AC402]|uniref:succinylglutamate-semialdehyde dehydrogenase n=1 Tax=Asticcacaulis sp. AC402 TaxID=1282361 RepID=UPI0003C3C6D9|nr:succinylglutamate-semialdehyde dehydrogenase [Asticcacaulis sp. AC402]ESQ74272.1 hypothetical protein ABAC402_15000 [Asticcacaulis sp. AC402]
MTRDVYKNGQWSAGDGPAFQKTCPASDEVVWSGHAASGAQVEAAVGAARAAFAPWALRPQAERIAILEAYADALTSRRDAIARAISRDMGKALWESLSEADAMAAKVAISVKAQAERAGQKSAAAAFGTIDLGHRPHGVMAVIGPFNFPGHLPNGHLVPALLAGNTCVFKPSELAPSVAALMVEAFEAAGLPQGCLNVVHGGREVGSAVLNARIDGLLFTGSVEAGLAFHRHFAGRPQIILALEMGGNNPLIVWNPADVEAAADIVFTSAFVTTGQRCSCARRLILPEGGFGDDVLTALVERIRTVPIGAWDQDVFMGSVVSAPAAQAALRFESDLLTSGAKPVQAFEHPFGPGAFLRPALIDVTHARDVPDTELFGPLLQVTRVRDFDSAIDRANATRFGLAAGFVGDDDDLWRKAYSHLNAGVLTRNRPTAGAPSSLPFGGPGLSGNHRPSAYYAADYCAWPQATQSAQKAVRQTPAGYGGGFGR